MTQWRTIASYILTGILALGAVWLFQTYLYKPFKVPTGSMRPALACGDRVFVQRFGKIEQGDIVVFYPPQEPGGILDPDTMQAMPVVRNDRKENQTYIKRAIGMPGDIVELQGGVAFVNGKELTEPYLHKDRNKQTQWGPVTVPKNAYLMLGDNRDYSSDGRTFGFVSERRIVGAAQITYWPIKNIGLIRKDQVHEHGKSGSGC